MTPPSIFSILFLLLIVFVAYEAAYWREDHPQRQGAARLALTVLLARPRR